MTREEQELRSEQRPPAPEFDRFGFHGTVGSYRDTGREAEVSHWSRPWTMPRDK